MSDTNTVLPSGNVTILFTDIEDSARIKRQPGIGDARYKQEMLLPHFERLRKCLADHQGYEHGTPAGDSIMAVFQNPDEALACARAIQDDLATKPIECMDAEGMPWHILVRIGVHLSEKHLEAGYYSGTDADFAARIMSLGKGGRILVSAHTRAAATAWERFTWYGWENRYIKSFEEEPETVHEMLWKPGLIAEEPGLRWLPKTFRVERNRYISRPTLEASIREHFTLLRNNGEKARLVTLHGFGGMGKTRLAVNIALKAVGSFKDGVYFVSLGERLPAAQSVIEALCTALDLKDNPTTLDDLLPVLQNSQSLLVLDNYESVHCAEVQYLIRDLLNATNHLHLLVTGREAVKIGDIEQRIPTDCMTMNESKDLFIARAQLLRSGWEPVTPDEHAALREILILTACIPLALELVAAHIFNDTLREIADTLQATPLPELPLDYVPSDPNERHASIERCLDWSWKYLTTEVQYALACVSLFADTFSANSVQQACALHNTKILLNKLHEAALLVRSELAGRTRYALLRPTRAYARQKFNHLPNASGLTQCYIAFYAQLASYDSDIMALELEWENAFAAAGYASEISDCQMFKISEYLGKFLMERGLWLQCKQLYQMALHVAVNLQMPEQKAGLTNDLGLIYRSQMRLQDAEGCFRESAKVFRSLGNHLGEAQSLANLGVIFGYHERYQEAEDYLMHSRNTFHEMGEEVEEARVIGNLGNLFSKIQRWEEAKECYLHCLKFFRNNHDTSGEGLSLNNLGNLLMSQGQWEESDHYFQQSLQVYRQTNNSLGEGQTLKNMSASKAAQGDEPKALEYAKQALQVLEFTQDERSKQLLREAIENSEKLRSGKEETEHPT